MPRGRTAGESLTNRDGDIPDAGLPQSLIFKVGKERKGCLGSPFLAHKDHWNVRIQQNQSRSRFLKVKTGELVQPFSMRMIADASPFFVFGVRPCMIPIKLEF